MIFVVKDLSAQQISIKDSTGKAFRKGVSLSKKGSFGPFYPHFVISPDFSVKNLSFFCRQELRFEAVTRIPLKFRLGSVQYVDWLEKKPNAWLQP